MLRRLRIKFILINMLLVTLVLLAVFGTLVYSTASQLERESVTVMTLMLRRDGIPPQFVADASHELKTPLTVILANAGIVEGHPDETVASQHKWISYIQEEAQRMKGLVEDMLFLAKHDDARQSAKTQVCNLSDLVTGCVLRFESVAFESGVELDSEIQPRLSIHGDLDCLERLVMILLDNAVKYAGEAGRVRLELQRR